MQVSQGQNFIVYYITTISYNYDSDKISVKLFRVKSPLAPTKRFCFSMGFRLLKTQKWHITLFHTENTAIISTTQAQHAFGGTVLTLAFKIKTFATKSSRVF